MKYIKLTSLITERWENTWVNFNRKDSPLPKEIAVNRYSKLMLFSDDKGIAILSKVQPTFKSGDKIETTWAKSTNARPYIWVLKDNKVIYHGMEFSMIGIEKTLKKYK